MLDGPDLLAYQNRGHDPFDVEVLLPEGEILRIEPDFVSFHTETVRRPNVDLPNTMDISRGQMTPIQARDLMLAVADQFGMDATGIDEWYALASSPGAAELSSVAETPWIDAEVGYIDIEMQGRYRPTSDSAVVHLILLWDENVGTATATATSSPTATRS